MAKRVINNPNLKIEKYNGIYTVFIYDNGEKKVLVNSDGTSSELSCIIPVTYNELKQLRDNSKLIPGMQYRITDYECTTTQKETKSAGHPFDIIVTADSKNTLNENARATDKTEQRPTLKLNGYLTLEGVRYDLKTRWYYDGVQYIEDASANMCIWKPEDPSSVSMFGDNPRLYTLQAVTDIQDIMTDVYIDMNHTVITWGTFSQFVQPTEVYPSSGMDYNNPIVKPMLYWKNCNLEAWELKYCLDNDVNRFEWASTKSIRSRYQEQYLMKFTGETREVSGQIYYYWRNDEADRSTYTLSSNPNIGDGTWWYDSDTGTMNDDGGVISVNSDGKGIIYYMKDEYGNECPYDFKNIMFDFSNESLGWLYTFTKNEHDASLLKDICQNNKILYNGKSIKLVVFNFADICSGNTFGSDCENILVNCKNCKNNTFINNISDLEFNNDDGSFSDNVIYPGDYNNYIISSETIGKILCLVSDTPKIGELNLIS